LASCSEENSQKTKEKGHYDNSEFPVLRLEGLRRKIRDRYAALSPMQLLPATKPTKLPPSTCAAESIPGKIPDALGSVEKAQWSLYRTVNNWFLFPSAFATRLQRPDQRPRRVLLCTLYIASVRF